MVIDEREVMMAGGIVLTAEFQRALELLTAGQSVFLTGKAGTGKSTLIRHFLTLTERSTITVAPTGVAALNVDGYTLHRLFSFPASVTEEFVRSPGYFPARFGRALRELDTLIVDETSMVRADLFDCIAAALERFGPRPGEPFGGVQLVLVGDLHQLPPVVADAEADFIASRYATPFFFSAKAFDADRFPTVELTRVFRQVGDPRLVDILNAVREGALVEAARAQLNTRTDATFEPPAGELWLTLATTNRIVRNRNLQMLRRLPGPVQTYEATLTGDLDGFELPTDESLQLAAGAQVMLLNNDPSDRWVNGSIGRINALSSDHGGPIVDVELRDGELVRVRPHTWEITRPLASGSGFTHEVIGTFRQLPLKLAWAVTIHKSQGQTLDNVVVDLTGGTFANGQLYVALSRCTSFEGLVLRRDVLPRDMKSDVRVRRFLAGSRAPGEHRGLVHLAALTVGNEGGRYRPRPVEIAVVTDEGDEATSVINPTSDLYEARTRFGLTTRDIQLAPVLSQAWDALAPLLAGRVPTGFGVDQLLGIVDFELKRGNTVAPIPLGLDFDEDLLTDDERARLDASTALERARAQRDIAARLLAGKSAAGVAAAEAFPSLLRGRGYLLARTTGGVEGPEGFVVGGNLSADDDPAQVLADELRQAWERVADKDAVVLARIRAAEQHFGVEIVPADFEPSARPNAEQALFEAARVCFTGTVVTDDGKQLDRDEMEAIALAAGLVPVPTVTKTRTDVLVVAERGTQSKKSRDAAKWGKPILDAREFLQWAQGG